MAVTKTYSTTDVGKILKDSENASVGASRGEGHAEAMHAIGAAGRGRANVTQQGLEERLIDERKTKVGAFVDCQIEAVTHALNSQAGQNALQYLEAAEYVFVRLPITTGTFQMVVSESELPAGKGKKIAGPMTKPASRQVTAPYLAMKLMKTPEGELHIRTAFPLDSAPAGGPSCQVTYAGASQSQELPV